jgi:outer membrane protein
MKKFYTAALVVAMSGISGAALAYEEGDWIVRLGAATVSPNEDSDKIVLPTEPPTVLRGVDIDSDTQLGIIGAYMLSDSFGLELLAATPFTQDISISGTNIEAGSVKHLPPTLSLQWYPRGGQSGWQPYLGLGVNYTIIFDEEVDSDLENALGGLLGASKVDLELDDSLGLAAQVGLDIPLGENWGLNAGIWYIDLNSTAKVKTDVGTVKFDVEIDPWVYNLGIFYKF